MSGDNEDLVKIEEEMINKAAEKIHKYGMEDPAILVLEMIKPIAHFSGQMGRFFVYPWLYILGDNVERKGDEFLNIFEKRENIEKLIKLLKKIIEDPEKKKEKKIDT